MSIYDNLLDASKDFINSDYVSNEQAEQRYDICQNCDKFWPITTQCSVCHCFMKIKTKLKSSKCPENKW